VLLNLSDLPGGFSQVGTDVTTPRKGAGFCKAASSTRPRLRIIRKFVKGGGVTTQALELGISEYVSADQARAIFDQVAARVSACKEETVNGRHLTYTSLSTDPIGDGTLGLKIASKQATLATEYVLQGNCVISVLVGGLTRADTNLLGQIAAKQLAAIKAA
jgi:hypothetical protein